VAAILTPFAANTELWWRNSPFTLISFIGWGVSNALILVVIGP
jgi:hypothetical protein